MKKLFALMCTLVVAFALSIPVFAKSHKSKKESTSVTETSKAHVKHSKKKGATKGKKKGQESKTSGKSK